MKILHIGNVNNVENYTKKTPFTESAEVVNAPLGLTDEAYAGLAPDAEMIIVDAITEISEKLIEKLPDLKLIHSEGVAFNRIDLAAAGKRGEPLRYLYPDDTKQQLLTAAGIQTVVSPPFPEIAAMDGETFCRVYLHDQMHAKKLFCGRDFRFGNRAAWGVADLAAFGETFGFTVELIDAVEQDGAVISSSRIRQLLLDGKIQQANRLLGAPYQISGIIQHGAALGRTIQFPTINLSLAPEQLVPLYGVYRAKVYLKDGSIWNGVTNIGTKPTVSNACIPVAETHLLGFQGDLYGQFCRIELLDFLRKEQKFSGLDKLKAAIADNIRTVQAACKQ